MTMTRTFTVELHGFGERGRVLREVDVPMALLDTIPATDDVGLPGALGLIFHFGQNDFQPKPMRSVSVGDIIRAGTDRFIVKGMGFEQVPAGWVTPVFQHGTEPDGSPHWVGEGEWRWGLPGCEDLRKRVLRDIP